ncbi:uncharacterized protein LOC126976802 isoform X2 [Leptidea sinapis]|uniref:uncharacterized protein LOC126976802 isoform X2 n=1 Tax=Leptidea sinapis TaxID=189913 RepID=UPI0021C3B573|nr:uncharacterized protein LOC126976802 isoform X2 [Leptidea sinapis]
MTLNKNSVITYIEEFSNGEVSYINKYWDYVINRFGIIGHHLISFLYSVYLNFTPFNVVVFLIKTVPMVVYMRKLMKDIYTNSQERMAKKKIELDDIELQLQIVNTKISVRDAEFSERIDQLKRNVEKLRNVRCRIREIIKNDEELRRKVNSDNIEDNDCYMNLQCTPEEEKISESEFIVELLKELKCNQVAEWERKVKNYGEHSGEPMIQESSLYSAMSETEAKPDPNGQQDCHVKIVKVTNVYKVAYLKHFIKQKRLRNAHRQAILKKRMENVKKLLEDWQNKLNMVIYRKLSLLNMNPHVEITTHEAMGDCFQFNCRDYSDTDSQFRCSFDNGNDDREGDWNQNTPSTMYLYKYDDPRTRNTEDDYYESSEMYHCDCNAQVPPHLLIVPEETQSQLIIEEQSQGEVAECRDLIII